jgi:type III secretory pathway component EscU
MSEALSIIIQTIAFILLGIGIIDHSFRIAHLRKDIDVLRSEIDRLYTTKKNKD